jgi:hypothetical protein
MSVLGGHDGEGEQHVHGNFSHVVVSTPIDMRCSMSVLAAQDADVKQHVHVNFPHAVVFHADRHEMFDERSSCSRCRG